MKRRTSAIAAASPSSEAPETAAEEDSIGWDDETNFLGWASNAVLIALMKDCASNGSAAQDGRFVFISPSLEAFDELARESPFISELWIFVASTVGRSGSYIDRIEEVATWTAHSPGGRPLLVLRGQTGHLLGVDDDGLFTLRTSSVHWSGEGFYQGASTPANTLAA